MDDLVLRALPILFDGVKFTIVYSFLSISIGFLLAIQICAARLSHAPLLSLLASVYISLFRGVPVLVQLLIFYYCLPLIGIDVLPAVAAVGALAMCTAAYQAEILRGGFLGVSPGQIEAAEISGLSRTKILWYIQVPLAVRFTLPSLINEATMMVKASSLISVVGVLELTRAAQSIVAATFEPLPIYMLAGAMYFGIVFVVTLVGSAVEKRYFLKAEL